MMNSIIYKKKVSLKDLKTRSRTDVGLIYGKDKKLGRLQNWQALQITTHTKPDENDEVGQVRNAIT